VDREEEEGVIVSSRGVYLFSIREFFFFGRSKSVVDLVLLLRNRQKSVHGAPSFTTM